jgi:branched-subunit amino acid permease
MIAGRLPYPTDLAFHGIFFALAAIASVSKNETFHKIGALLAAAILVIYVALLFMQLR